MRTSGTVQVHGLCTRYRHIERAHIGLSVFEGNVSAMYSIGHGCTRFVGRRLGDSVVAIGELELYYVADGRGDGVRDKGILWAADDDGDDLTGAAEGVAWL